MSKGIHWTNPSARLLAHAGDPIVEITKEARSVVFRALEAGWSGPPFDPLALAELLHIETVPASNVLDARTISLASDKFRIEFNPDRPRHRVRFSLFHEIAHTLFQDCASSIRHRGTHQQERRDSWQLEMLCNVAAAELLMPVGTLGEVDNIPFGIDSILKLRGMYEASTEAVLLRFVRLTSKPCMAFAVRRDPEVGRYVVDYAQASRSWKPEVHTGFLLPSGTVAAQCAAIGYTAKGVEAWSHGMRQINLECVGIPPYPNEVSPRVVGLAFPAGEMETPENRPVYLKGDATKPRPDGFRVLAQVVNDRARSWGAGFPVAVKRKWPSSQEDFTKLVQAEKAQLTLGNVIEIQLEPNLLLASLVCQHGYGPSPTPRIRYGAMERCLRRVSEIAHERNASVHMPRIGCGLAGGSWSVIGQIIDEILCGSDLKVFIYDLPEHSAQKRIPNQLSLTG